MSVIHPNESAKSWRASKREPTVQLYLSSIDGDSALLAGARVAGFPLSLNTASGSDWIDPAELSAAAAAIIQVDTDNPVSVKRFQKLSRTVATPLIAAAFEPPLALVRSLVRAGAHDVVPLPLNIEDLETSLGPLRDQLEQRDRHADTQNAKVVSVIKSVGGVGATVLATQLAVRFAINEAIQGREVGLLDLDVQFGDIAFQLGLHARLSLADLLDAGVRLDGELLRATTTQHASGLHVITAPPEMLPLEGINSDNIMEIVELASREFGTVFVDLPTNWTNWSLSLLARSDLVLLVTELSVASLNRAKRQLSLMRSQDLNLEVRVVVNRYEKGLLRTIRASDVREALGHEIAYTVSNDFPLIHAAIERGLPIAEIRRKSAISKDLDILDAGIAAALGLER